MIYSNSSLKDDPNPPRIPQVGPIGSPCLQCPSSRRLPLTGCVGRWPSAGPLSEVGGSSKQQKWGSKRWEFFGDQNEDLTSEHEGFFGTTHIDLTGNSEDLACTTEEIIYDGKRICVCKIGIIIVVIMIITRGICKCKQVDNIDTHILHAVVCVSGWFTTSKHPMWCTVTPGNEMWTIFQPAGLGQKKSRTAYHWIRI